LIVTAKEDLLLPPGKDAAGLAALPDAQVMDIDGAGHSLPTEAPRRLNDLALQFLDR